MVNDLSTGHERYLELLPWYVKGTLSRHDRKALRAHLSQCLSCNAALREEQRLSELLEQGDTIPFDRQHGINRLLERIDREQGRGTSKARARPPLARYALATAISGLVVWGLIALPRAFREDPGEAAFSTLSSGAGIAPNRIDVVFFNPPDDDGLDRFLADLGGVLVGGPTDLGRYTIEVEIEPGKSMTEIVEALREDSRVQFAGRAFTEGAPTDASAP